MQNIGAVREQLGLEARRTQASRCNKRLVGVLHRRYPISGFDQSPNHDRAAKQFGALVPDARCRLDNPHTGLEGRWKLVEITLGLPDHDRVGHFDPAHAMFLT